MLTRPSVRVSSVEPPPTSIRIVPLVQPAEPALRHRRLFVTAQQPRREAVAPLDLAQERLAVLGVPDRARRDEQRALRAERLELATVLGEGIPNPGDRQRQEPVTRIDPLAEPGYGRTSRNRLHVPLDDVRDEQTSGVRALIDGRNAHGTANVAAAIIAARRGVEQSGSSPGS